MNQLRALRAFSQQLGLDARVARTASHAAVRPSWSRLRAFGSGSDATSSQPAPAAMQPGGTKKSFYKRNLPSPPAVAFSSPEGKQLFAEALQAGGMGGFFKLIEQYSTQDEPAFCGLASLAMVLNALSIDPRRTWKGSWRWFHEKLLDCCLPLDVVEREGIVLQQAACLARCNGAQVGTNVFGTFSEDEFRAAVAEVTSTGAEHIIVSYTRKAFLQTGDGHFSPVGGYHAGRDLVLILDTARFKYPPHWVPLPLLYKAMAAVDPVTGQPRGFMRLAPQPLLDSVLFTLDIRSSAWQPACEFIQSAAVRCLPELAAGRTAEEAVRALVRSIPLDSLESFIVQRVPAPAQTNSAFEPCTTSCSPGPLSPASPPPASSAPATAEQAGSHVHSSACGTSCGHTSHQQHDHHRHPQQQKPPKQPPEASASGEAPSERRSGSPPRAGSPLLVHPAMAKGDTRCIPVGAQQQLLHEIRCLPLHQLVTEEVEALATRPDTRYLAEKVCMLLLLQQPAAWPAVWPNDEEQQARFSTLLDASAVSIVEAEVRYLREQLAHIDEVLQYGSAHAACAQPLDCATLGCSSSPPPTAAASC